MLSEFLREQSELPRQKNLDKKKYKNCTYFTSVQDMETFFAHKIGFSGMANSNLPSEYFREHMALPWQPNLGKKMNQIGGQNLGPKETTSGICGQRT